MKKFLLIMFALFCFQNSIKAQNFIYLQNRQVQFVEDSTSALIVVSGDSNVVKRVVTRLESLFNGEKDKVCYSVHDDVIFLTSPNLPLFSKQNIIQIGANGSQDSIAFMSYAKEIEGNYIWFRNELLIE